MQLWIVGKNMRTQGKDWNFQGVFDSKEKAIAACRNEYYFVGEATLNKSLPDHEIKWEGAYYPKSSED